MGDISPYTCWLCGEAVQGTWIRGRAFQLTEYAFAQADDGPDLAYDSNNQKLLCGQFVSENTEDRDWVYAHPEHKCKAKRRRI